MIGICFGSFMGVYPSFTAGQFGRLYSSVNYGIMFIGFNMVGLLGPIIIGKVFSQTGSYQLAFVVAIIFSAIGLGLTFVYNALQKKQVTQ